MRKHHVGPLDHDEYDMLWRQFNRESFTEFRDFTYLMLLTLVISVRHTSSLRVSDIHESRTLRLEASTCDLIIPDAVSYFLEKYLKARKAKNPSTDALFITNSGRRLPHIYFRVAIPRYVRLAGIRPGQRCTLDFLSYSALVNQSCHYSYLLYRTVDRTY